MLSVHKGGNLPCVRFATLTQPLTSPVERLCMYRHGHVQDLITSNGEGRQL